MHPHTRTPKRVLILSLAYYPRHVGGAEVAIKELTDRISSQDIEFHLVCLRFDDALPAVERVGNVLVHRIGPTRSRPSPADLKRFPLHYSKHLFQVLAAWKAHSLHLRYRYDGVWAMMAHSCGVPAALFSLMHPHVPLALTLQEGDPPEHIERMMRPVWPLFKRAFTAPVVIQTISDFLARWARSMGATCPVEVVPNGVDTARFTAPVPEAMRVERCERLGKEEGDTFLITTSRLVHKNAVDDVIRALALLPETVKFAVLGIGPDETTLRELAEREGVSKRVRFVGQVDHAELPAYLAACDIFIRPSRSEGMGNSFIEAMAAGLPVVATQVGGISDFLFDAKRNPDKPTTGWAVSKDSPQEITEAVRNIMADPEQVRRVTTHAREVVKTRYDWNRIAQDMRVRVFDRILSR